MQICFRVDASVSMGSGHVMRCLAIAQEWMSRKVSCVFLVHECSANLSERLKKEGCELVFLKNDSESELADIYKQYPAEVIFVDGYHFSSEYRKKLHGIFRFTVLMDDSLIEQPYWSDFVINPQPMIDNSRYESLDSDKLLLGLNYLPLRKEFSDRHSTLPLQKRNHILVTFGGTDPERLSLPVTQKLLERITENVVLDVVIGDDHKDKEELLKLERQFGSKINVHMNVKDMATLMHQAGMAVSAAGSTVWELVAVGVPVIPVIVSENQKVIKHYPYWQKPIDLSNGRPKALLDSIVRDTIDLWKDVESRKKYSHDMKTVNLSYGSGRICDRIQDMVMKELAR